MELLIAVTMAGVWLTAYAIHVPTMRWWYPAVVAFVASFTTSGMVRRLLPSAQRSAEGAPKEKP